MSAREKISIKNPIKKLGIVAGSGVLPQQLLQAVQARGIDYCVVGFKEYADHVTPDFWARLGTAGQTIAWLKAQGVTDLVLIGAIRRPRLLDLWPDWVTIKFLIKAWCHSLGDSDFLSGIRGELEEMGFCLHGVHEFLPELLMPEGVLGQHKPQGQAVQDIQVGIQAAIKHGANDKGQAVIVKDGQVIAHEDKRGTNYMIKHYGAGGAVLVKMCKPQQDKDLDLPTIGPQTAQLCAAKNMAGIAAQAGYSLLAERDVVNKIADEAGLFVVGVSVDG